MYEQKTPAFLQTKSISFAQIFPYSHPKQPFFTLHFPFAPSHNLLSTKNPAILLQSALNPYAVTPERRTDSKPFRRCFVRKTGFGSCRRKFLQKYFRQSFESRSQDGVDSLKHGRLAHVRSQFSLFRRSPTHKNLPLATFCTSERVFAVLFARRKKYQSVSLTGKFRGFPNLESAHQNNNFPLTKLNPFAAFDPFRFAERVVPVGAAHSVCFFSPYGGVPYRELPRFCKSRISSP